MTIDDSQEQFQLEPTPVGLMTLATAAKSFGVSRQAFHRWCVKPVRVQGTRRYYDLAAVIENRLEHAESADRTPEHAEIERYQARLDLLTEQLENQRLKNQAQRQRYAPGIVGEWVVANAMQTAARIIQRIPAAVLEVSDKIVSAESLLIEEAKKAGDVLRSAEIERAADIGKLEIDS